MSLDDELRDAGQLEHYKDLATRLQRRLNAKEFATGELIAAVQKAAADAALLHPPATPMPAPKRSGKKATELVAVLHTTDWQYGKRTEDFDREIATERLTRMVDKARRVIAAQRSAHRIDRIVVLAGGDMVEGLGIFPGQAHEVDGQLFDQLFGAAELLERVVRSLAADCPDVEVYSIHGNHGRIGRKGDLPSTDNIDAILYRVAHDRLKDLKRVRWTLATKWHQIVEIGNYKALLIHGDQIKQFGGNTPHAGIMRKATAWASGAIQTPFMDAYCVDDTTEALTPDGWKSYYEIEGQPIATLHPDTGAFEWQQPSRVLSYEYEGPMVHHQGRSMDHFATPDHRMWTRRHNGTWHKELAENVTAGSNWLYRCSASAWAGTWFLPEAPTNIKNAAPEDVAALVGWYLAEGHSSRHQLIIAQHQERKSEYHQEIFDLLQRLGYSPRSWPFYVRVCNTELATWLRTHFGHLAPNKQIPEWAKDWPAPELEAMFRAMIKGDGSLQRPDAGHYYSASTQLTDAFQEICLKLGFATSAQTRPARGFGNLPSHQTAFSPVQERRMPGTKTIEEFTGTVWCPTVENGLWFMRRNGRVVVTGNCGHFHTPMTATMPNGNRIYITGSPESANEYAAEFIAARGDPSQRLHFVDPIKGRVVSEHTLWLGDDNA